MREIKFRSWHIPTKKMFDVFSWCKDCVFEDSMDGVGTSPYLPAETKDCILLQFTGLKDKKGTEIYEGDILQFRTKGFDAETFITTIIFDKCSFKLQNNRALFYFGQSDFTKIDDAIVIGNIHENP